MLLSRRRENRIPHMQPTPLKYYVYAAAQALGFFFLANSRQKSQRNQEFAVYGYEKCVLIL